MSEKIFQTIEKLKNWYERGNSPRCDNCGKVMLLNTLKLVSTTNLPNDEIYLYEDTLGGWFEEKIITVVNPFGSGSIIKRKALCGSCNQQIKSEDKTKGINI